MTSTSSPPLGSRLGIRWILGTICLLLLVGGALLLPVYQRARVFRMAEGTPGFSAHCDGPWRQRAINARNHLARTLNQFRRRFVPSAPEFDLYRSAFFEALQGKLDFVVLELSDVTDWNRTTETLRQLWELRSIMIEFEVYYEGLPPPGPLPPEAEEFFKELGKREQLDHISFRCAEGLIDWKWTHHLSRCGNLREIVFQVSAPDDEILAELAKLPNLKELTIPFRKDSLDQTLRIIQAVNPDLKVMAVRQTPSEH